jgi:hypothetical protein
VLLAGCEKDNFNDIIDRESVIEDFPVPGNNGNILVSEIRSDRVTLSWESASDDNTSSSELRYIVITSLNDNISNVETAISNGTVSMAWTAGSSTHTVTGLDSGEIIYVNILVKDGDGYISAYTKVSVMTSLSGAAGSVGIYLISAGNTKGDFGGRLGADKICREYITVNFPSLPVNNMRAFISINAVDQIADFPANFGVPAGVAIMGPTGKVIADDWLDLTDGDIKISLLDAEVGSPLTSWWSGSDSYGIVATDICNSISDSTSSNGQIGAHNTTDSSWISNGTRPCNSNQTLICIGW